MKNKKNYSIWLIGPSATGKTTISNLLHEETKNNNISVVIDGDQMRSLYENTLGYDKVSRSKSVKRYVNLVKWLNNFKVSSIVATISAFEKDRQICRQEINNYHEIYLHTSKKERIKRDKKDLYAPALRGEKKNVVDVDIPFEDPLNCNFRINTDNKTPKIIVKEIRDKLGI
jgi:adenylylsulfate kinase-like enzyme